MAGNAKSVTLCCWALSVEAGLAAVAGAFAGVTWAVGGVVGWGVVVETGSAVGVGLEQAAKASRVQTVAAPAKSSNLNI